MNRNKWAAVFAAAVCAGVLLAGCGGSEHAVGSAGAQTEQTASKTVTVFAAKSMTDCLDELIAAYEAQHADVAITVNYAGSGDLQSQIENGAPCDLFLSAAQTQMDALCEEGLMADETRRDLLTNEAVLVTPKEASAVTSFEDLALHSVEQVAIGNPDSVPVGQYAEEILTTLGIWDIVYDKAVLGSDVRQVLAWCETGEVDAGIVYATDAAVTDDVTVVCAAPEGSCAPVVYPVALTADGADNEAAQDVLTFLQSDAAAEVFEAYGFGMAQ